MSAENDLEGNDIWGGDESKQDEGLEDDDTRHMSVSELRQRIHLLNNDIRVMKSDVQRISYDTRGQRDRIRENMEKVKLNKQLPYLVANVVEILEPDAEDGACVVGFLFRVLVVMDLHESARLSPRVRRLRSSLRYIGCLILLFFFEHYIMVEINVFRPGSGRTGIGRCHRR